MQIKKYQEGGDVPMTPEEQIPSQGAPEGAAQDPMAQIQQMAQQIIEAVGPDAAMALAQTIIQMLQGGGASQEAVAMKNGGRLVRKGGTLSNGQAYFKNY